VREKMENNGTQLRKNGKRLWWVQLREEAEEKRVALEETRRQVAALGSQLAGAKQKAIAESAAAAAHESRFEAAHRALHDQSDGAMRASDAHLAQTRALQTELEGLRKYLQVKFYFNNWRYLHMFCTRSALELLGLPTPTYICR
jgi:hypothetical protein